MAQGFKPAKASSAAKPSGGRAKGKGKASQPKTGARSIAPKKQNAIREAAQKQRNTASITKRIEADMAGRAMKGGPLTIMRKAALEAEQIKEGKKAGLKDGAIRAKATMRS